MATYTSMAESLTAPVNGSAGLESAAVAQLTSYTANSLNVYNLSIHSETGALCIIGNYFLEDADPGVARYVAFVGFTTSPLEGLDTATWTLTAVTSVDNGQFISQDEAAGAFGICEVPTDDATWNAYRWVVVGHAITTDVAALPYSFPNQRLAPFILGVSSSGAVTVLSSDETSTLGSFTWLRTGSGAANTPPYPMFLADVVFDPQNSAIVAVGCAATNISPNQNSLGMVVEMTGPTTAPTLATNTDIAANIFGSGQWPSVYRSCAIQYEDPDGTEVANRTLVLIGGTSFNLILDENRATLSLYQPHFSNPWTTQRWLALDNGRDIGSQLWATLGLSGADAIQYVTSVERVTTDEDDLYFIGGSTINGPMNLVFRGLKANSDNQLNNLGINNTITWSEYADKSADTQTALEAVIGPAVDDSLQTFGVVGLTNRKTKILFGGQGDKGKIAPTSFGGSTGGWILPISRGVEIYGSDPTLQSKLLQTENERLLVAAFSNSGHDDLIIHNGAYNETTPPNSTSYARVVTDNTAQAYFEYLLYDGIDALIAKKLQQLGVRVTIANVEWYKQDILKEGLDLDADFFREWAESQEAENKQRDKLARFYGNARPTKRQVRTDIFDDYAHMEELLDEMDKQRENQAVDESPWSDEVADAQEARKREKQVADMARIEKEVSESSEDDS